MGDQAFQLSIAVVGGLMSLVGAVLCLLLSKVVTKVSEMSQSISQLNEKMAVVISDQNWHREAIKENKELYDNLKTRLTILENKTSN